MQSISHQSILATSLLDRLQINTTQIETTKTSLLRDLFHLFNTKISHFDYRNYPEVEQSIITYGLPDFIKYEANTKTISQKIQAKIEQLLLQHEPRLRDVVVSINKIEKTTITFSITATLLNEPEPITIEFDSKYQPTLQQFTVKEHTS